MKQLITWIIRNRKTVLTVAGLVAEYVPKALRYGKAKLKELKETRAGQKQGAQK